MPGWEGNWRRTLQAIACRTGHYFTSCRLQDGTPLYKMSLAGRDTALQAVACNTGHYCTSCRLHYETPLYIACIMGRDGCWHEGDWWEGRGILLRVDNA